MGLVEKNRTWGSRRGVSRGDAEEAGNEQAMLEKGTATWWRVNKKYGLI